MYYPKPPKDVNAERILYTLFVECHIRFYSANFTLHSYHLGFLDSVWALVPNCNPRYLGVPIDVHPGYVIFVTS